MADDSLPPDLRPTQPKKPRMSSDTVEASQSSTRHDDPLETSPVASPSDVDGVGLNTIVKLNVGGTFYDTTLVTLTEDPDTMLANMFKGDFPLRKDDHGRFFIDSDGHLFRYILSYLRHGTLPPSHQVYAVYRVADFFCMTGLKRKLELMPEVALRKMHEVALAQFPALLDHVHQILRTAQDMTETYRVGERFVARCLELSVRSTCDFKPHGPNHHCARTSTSDAWPPQPVHVKIGPQGIHHKPELYMGNLKNFMVSLGYTVSHSSFDQTPSVAHLCQDSEGRSCNGKLYRLRLRWLSGLPVGSG